MYFIIMTLMYFIIMTLDVFYHYDVDVFYHYDVDVFYHYDVYVFYHYDADVFSCLTLSHFAYNEQFLLLSQCFQLFSLIVGKIYFKKNGEMNDTQPSFDDNS